MSRWALSCLAVVLHLYATCAYGQPPKAFGAALSEFDKARGNGASNSELLDRLVAMEEFVDQQPANSTSESVTGECRLQIAHRYYRLGMHAEARAGFDAVRNIGRARALDKIDSLRMLAQYDLYHTPNPALAVQYLHELLELVKTNSAELGPSDSTAYTGIALLKLSEGYKALGELEKSIEYRNLLIHEDIAFGPGEREYAILENGRDYTELKQNDRAVASYDQLFREFPDYGMGDGLRVLLEREQVLAHGEQNPRDLARELARLWEDPRFSKFFQTLLLAAEIVDLLASVNDHEAIVAFGLGAVDRIDAMYMLGNFSVVDKGSIEWVYVDTLYRLAEACFQTERYTQALEFFNRLQALFPTYADNFGVADRIATLQESELEARKQLVDTATSSLTLGDPGDRSTEPKPREGPPEETDTTMPPSYAEPKQSGKLILVAVGFAVAIVIGAAIYLRRRK